jgi:hypothetical protein
MRRTLLAVGLALVAPVVTAPVTWATGLTVGAGSTVNFADAAVDLGCADLVVAGTLNTDSATVAQALDVTIASGGTLDGGSGTLDVTRDWNRVGTFNAGTGEVRFVDGCSTTSSAISGATTFHDLSLTTSSGKQILFTAGETTTVAGALTLGGASGNLLVIRSTVGGSEAFLDLAQPVAADFVDVQDNDASAGSQVALGPNSIIGSNTSNWLTGPMLPGLGALGLATLALSLAWGGRRALASRPKGPRGALRV